MTLTAEELLAGSQLTFTVTVPGALLDPGGGAGDGEVRLRPLTVSDLQLIHRAGREQDRLTSILMVQRALVEPEMSVAQVSALPGGLLTHLLEEVNRVSGLKATEAELLAATESPIVQAALLLSREYGWTPQEVNGLTLGQVLLHLQMLRERGG